MSRRRIDRVTCGHCVAPVPEELSTLEGAENIGVLSTATITASRELDPERVNEAVIETG